MYEGATFTRGTCYDTMEDIKAGTFGQVCERITIKKVLSDDFAKTGICSFWVGEEDFIATSFAMAFQVKRKLLLIGMAKELEAFSAAGGQSVLE